MSEIRQEAGLARTRQEIRGARYVITGDVTGSSDLFAAIAGDGQYKEGMERSRLPPESQFVSVLASSWCACLNAPAKGGDIPGDDVAGPPDLLSGPGQPGFLPDFAHVLPLTRTTLRSTLA